MPVEELPRCHPDPACAPRSRARAPGWERDLLLPFFTPKADSRRSRRRPPRNDRIGYGAALLEKTTDARLWRGGRGLWSTFSCSVVDVGSRSRRFGFRDRQAGDPQPGGVGAMLDVESDQEGGDVLHDARVLQVSAVDGANTRDP